ncbi:MAG: hypothetical protein JW801_17375 [Bacteroidales bacterium]|nr:hypothetical protein [Bacteroidales bacterium]
MLKKILTTFSIIVIYLFSLAMFGWMVSHVVKGDKNFGILNKPIEFMFSFPDTFAQAVKEVNTNPPTFLPTPEGFTPINRLEEDFIVLTTYTNEEDNRTVALVNLKNDEELYTWNIENPYEEHDRIMNPLLFPDKSLIYSFEGKELVKIDAKGKVLWKQDSIWTHHSKNIDADGNIWICSFAPTWAATAMYKLNGIPVYYNDNYITKLDPETGRILYHKSVTEILTENGLIQNLLKSPNYLDPIHLNDVEPAMKNTKYYKKGDVFLSSRCASFFLQFRPSTDKVIRMIEGPFANQHDVDFLDDNSLVFFNNNYYTIWSFESMKTPMSPTGVAIAGDLYSNIGHYDFETGEISFIGDSVFRANQILTQTEGLVQFVDPSTYLVEEQNTGLIWVIRDDEVIYKNVFDSPLKGYHHLPNWTRVITNYD